MRNFSTTLILLIGLVAISPLSNKSDLYAQARDAGQAVVPRGYENEDSVRFNLFMINDAAFPCCGYGMGRAYADSLADEVGATFEGNWSYLAATSALAGKRKGMMARYGGEGPLERYFDNDDHQWKARMISLGTIAQRIKQRVYYPSPFGVMNYRFSRGFLWRYNVMNGIDDNANWHYNTYDANDISPYAEYPKNHDFVLDTFNTLRSGSWQNCTYGDSGKVILGWSDERNAKQMARVVRNMFPHWGPSDTSLPPPSEQPGQFSTHLEFNIDVDTTTMDTTNRNGRFATDLPLLRVQILYKKGVDTLTPGWPTLPMVPYKDSLHPSNPGWWLISEQIVTKRMYDTLPDTWRIPDTLESGAAARPWNFKQLYLRLNDMPQSLKDLIYHDSLPGPGNDWGFGAVDDTTMIRSQIHPDQLCEPNNSGSRDAHLIEIRILSTYRSTVRVRSLAYQDTLADGYFLRKKDGAVSVSCKIPPPNVFSLQPGGFDDSVKRIVDEFATALGGTTREIMVNDTDPWEWGGQSGLLTSILGNLDYHGSKQNIHIHYREQDFGNSSLHTRRNRLSYDGKPPSLYENQVSAYLGSVTWDAVRTNPITGQLEAIELRDSSVFPRDYVFNTPQPASSAPWPSNGDSMFSLYISRSNMTTGDPLKAYHLYTEQRGGGTKYFPWALRKTARVALQHPKNKRFAVEAATQGWSSFHPHRTLDTANLKWVFDPISTFFVFRPTTPEEINAHFWIALANGYTSFNNPQAVDGPFTHGGAPGLWGVAKRTNPADTIKFTHDFNVGHEYAVNHMSEVYIPNKVGISNWTHPDGNPASYIGDTSDANGDLPDWYVGYSNTWRAYKRVVGRINAVYSPMNSDFPIREFEWLDAYTTHRALCSNIFGDSDDSSTRAKGFLKVVRTVKVSPWARGLGRSYIDSVIPDSAHRTYVEVGLFRHRLNGSLQPKGYAALIVNTRLWPTLNDPVDSTYFNEGLTEAKDRSQSTLGDIDVRKVYMKIDPTMMHDSMKSTYYVVRDIWHPDTCWLVHKDSEFAVYIKPGDAKFLYIEKGISIRVSPTAETETEDFAYNNGRRVAELMGGTRTVVVYSKADKLYASYPSMGHTFSTYNKNTSSDNIETGREEQLDDDWCKKPSVMVAQNDTGVAIVYWVMTDSRTKAGELRAAYRKHPDSTWKMATYPGVSFRSTATSGSGVTPVLAPLNDTAWIVAARYYGDAFHKRGILACRFTVNTQGQPTFIADTQTYIIEDPIGFESTYPTIASRPLDDSLWPVRVAYLRSGKIFRRALKWKPGTSLTMTTPFEVSGGMPDDCIAWHPSIAMAGGLYKFRFGLTTFSYPFITERIAWESKITGLQSSGDNAWPVTRGSIQHWSNVDADWGAFTVFRPDSTSPENYHYPIVSTEPVEVSFNDRPGPGVWKDNTRIMWQNIPIESIEGRHVGRPMANDQWAKSYIYRNGRYVSLAQSTDSLQRWTDSSMVPKSIVWAAQPGGSRKIDITNGWMPQINSYSTYDPWYYFVIKAPVEEECKRIGSRLGIEDPKLLPPTGGPRDVPLLPVPPLEETPITHKWPASPTRPFDVRSDTFTVRGNDSIQIYRVLDSIDVTTIRSNLSGPGDFVMFTMRLLRSRDSSYVYTLDSLVVTPTALRVPNGTPGLLLDYATLKLPSVAPIDTVFIAAEMRRGSTNTLELGILQMLTKGETLVSNKRTTEAHSRPIQKGYLSLSVQPNPFNSTTFISVKTIEGMPTVIELVDALGRRMQTLHDGEAPVGDINLVLEGDALPAGTYFVRVLSGGEVQTRKLQLVK